MLTDRDMDMRAKRPEIWHATYGAAFAAGKHVNQCVFIATSAVVEFERMCADRWDRLAKEEKQSEQSKT